MSHGRVLVVLNTAGWVESAEIVSVLEEAGYTSAACTLDRFFTEQPYIQECNALLLVGLGPRVVQGVELVERIRSLAHGLPIVVISGHREVDVVKEIKAHGVCGFISKPIKYSLLIQAVKEALQTKTAP